MLCRRQGTERVAEQLVASEEGLFCMTLIVVHFNDFDIILEGISKAAAVLSVLMKVYTIPCHDRGYINVMLGFFRAAAILCTFCPVRPVRHMQHRLIVHVTLVM